MLKPRWTYSNPRGLTKWYGHVDYYGPYVIGQWFALDAESGTEYWSRRFFRPTDVRGFAQNVIVASEMRSDGPWTADFGIYGIGARTGKLLWTSHARGLWGRLLRCLDYVPGFTNEFRDVPKEVVDHYVVTGRGRILDVVSGRECRSVTIETTTQESRSRPEQKLYDNKSLNWDADTIAVEGARDNFVIRRHDKDGREVWRFAAKDLGFHVDGNYYSYRLHDGMIFLVLGDAPHYVPIDNAKPFIVRPNPANYQIGVLNVPSGELSLRPVVGGAQQKECRIEAIRDTRLLVSCEGKQLTEYEIAT
jgi:hypothetical protein